jgi:hypothetical protein
MNEEDTQNTFNPQEFINSLIAEMGLQDEEPEKVEQLKNGIEKQMTDIILNTASLNLDPEVMDYVTERYMDVENPLQFFIQLIKHDFGAQIAVLDALDKFKEQTLSVFNRLKKM